MAKNVTPLRQQYLKIKKEYPDAIVFFRLGDFYETFDEDAEKTAEALDIVLTSRPVAKGLRVPMAGIPFHAVDNYLGRLIEKGYHVAICEQVGEQPDKGLFDRGDPRYHPRYDRRAQPFARWKKQLSGLSDPSEGKAGLAYVDISTGELAATEISEGDIENQLRAELQRLGPAEVLLSETADEKVATGFNVTRIPNWYFEPGRSVEIIRAQFSVSDLSGLGLKPYPLAVRATGALLKFLQETQKSLLNLELSFSTYSLSDFMVLDAETQRNLELTETLREAKTEGSLLSVLDKTHTPMGKRLLRSWVNKPCSMWRASISAWTRCNISLIAALKDARSLICSNNYTTWNAWSTASSPVRAPR